jgi:uncharacterized Fe-S cluster protein YjdI
MFGEQQGTLQGMAQDSLVQKRREESAEAARIVVIHNGPYVVDGSIAIVDHLGVPVTADAPVRLCRCGLSQTKPFCDDSHIRRGFTDGKDQRRVPDKLDVYAGQQAHVFDNRGTCAHSGFCTDRLNSVFHLGHEPFVSPSGARLDDLVNAVRKCPSGALGIGIGPAREPNLSDTKRPPQIEISRDGPVRSPRKMPAPRRSISACAGAAHRSTSRSAAECIGASHFMIPSSTRCTNRPCSNGRAVIPRCWT